MPCKVCSSQLPANASGTVQNCSVLSQMPALQLTMERWPPCQQLEQNGADTPQVRLGVILVEVEDFRSHVQRGPAQRFCQTLQSRAKILNRMLESGKEAFM